MTDTERLAALLAEIDALLARYDPGDLAPDRIVGDIIAERSRQEPLFGKAIELANQGLKGYPLHPELLRRRALAYSYIVTADFTYDHLDESERDLRSVLATAPNHLSAALEMLELQFTFSGMEDAEVAELAKELARRATKLLLDCVALQIKALGYAGQHAEAEEVFDEWALHFPRSQRLQRAKASADELKG